MKPSKSNTVFAKYVFLMLPIVQQMVNLDNVEFLCIRKIHKVQNNRCLEKQAKKVYL